MSTKLSRQEKRLLWLQAQDALTTEQLAELVILSLDRMTPAEKAEVRAAFRWTAADREFLRRGGIKL